MFANAAVLAAIGAGLVTIGAALGISRLAVAALESSARQPEIQPKLQTMMIIAAALIEGVALFCAVICIIAVGK
jgi:F-type H+-transporting ATPase subunit c